MKHSLLQLIIAAILAIAGLGLLFVGILLAPQGEIHETVLVAFGEVATFAGSIIGIDYHYKKSRHYENDNPQKKRPAGKSYLRLNDPAVQQRDHTA